MARWVELIGGVLATVIGLMVAAVILALGGAAWAIGLVGLSGIGAGLGAYQHSLHRGGSWLALLWVSSLVLVIMTILAVFSVGIFLLPGTLAALVAAGVGSWRSATDSGAAR